MSYILSVVSQKGGVGKSTLCRLLAREFAAGGYATKIADLDVGQGTCVRWQSRRLQAALSPSFSVEAFASVESALKELDRYDVLILDGAPHASEGTLRCAKAADLVLLPTGLSVDDLVPGVTLAHDLKASGISPDVLAFVLCRVGDSPGEIEEARRYLQLAGYRTLRGEIPERTAYRRASDEGRALTETRYPSLNDRADQVAQAIIDALAKE